MPPKAAGTNSDKEAGLMTRLSASRPPLSLLEGGGVSCRLAPASRRLRTRRVLVEHMRGEWQRGAMLAYASLPPKAAESNTDKATSWLAKRLPARDSPLSLMEGAAGAAGWRWPAGDC